MLGVTRAVRSGYGRLSLSAVARCLPTPGDQKTRYKRLGRFLNNRHVSPEVMAPELTGLVLGSKKHRRAPILIDQTDVGGTPTLMAGLLHWGRVAPIGFTCFEYAKLRRSQNTLETAFLTLIVASLPPGTRAIFTGDRQYGCYQLINALNGLAQLYILRCKNNVVLWRNGKACFPRDFRAPVGVPTRYANLRYRKHGQEPVDLIVYREHGLKETWYLLVPAGSEELLPTDEVVRFYRSRMQSETPFRVDRAGVSGLEDPSGGAGAEAGSGSSRAVGATAAGLCAGVYLPGAAGRLRLGADASPPIRDAAVQAATRHAADAERAPAGHALASRVGPVRRIPATTPSYHQRSQTRSWCLP